MLNVGVIGLGNTGNQIAALAAEELKIPAMAINSSEKDLETIANKIPKILISDTEGVSKGAGKNRALAKSYLKDSILSIISKEDVQTFISDLNVLFLVSSTGGGTGSGTALLMANIISSMFVDTHVIVVGILPVMSEALSAHVNSLEYLNELYGNLENQTYMLYDNDSLYNIPSYKMMDTINREVVKDIDVLRCTFNYTTKYDSIDEQDMKRLISFPGRIMVTRLEDLKERDLDKSSIEDLLISKIKNTNHVELQRDRKVTATGIIVNLSEQVFNDFDNHIPAVREFIGDPDHDFNHLAINEDRKMPNNVFLIMSGMSQVNDRIQKISDRIEEIEERQKIREEESQLDTLGITELSQKISSKDAKKTLDTDKVDLANIFSKFGL
jgi:cell division GTPase FtsZ